MDKLKAIIVIAIPILTISLVYDNKSINKFISFCLIWSACVLAFALLFIDLIETPSLLFGICPGSCIFLFGIYDCLGFPHFTFGPTEEPTGNGLFYILSGFVTFSIGFIIWYFV